MVQQNKTGPQGQNLEFPIPSKEEALNSRKLGGETIAKFPAEQSVVNAPKKSKSKYPLQVSRSGERRI